MGYVDLEIPPRTRKCPACLGSGCKTCMGQGNHVEPNVEQMIMDGLAVDVWVNEKLDYLIIKADSNGCRMYTPYTARWYNREILAKYRHDMERFQPFSMKMSTNTTIVSETKIGGCVFIIVYSDKLQYLTVSKDEICGRVYGKIETPFGVKETAEKIERMYGNQIKSHKVFKVELKVELGHWGDMGPGTGNMGVALE